VKLFTGSRVHEVEAEVRALRAVLGPEAFFAVDAICRYDLASATRLGRCLDDISASYFEAPLNAEDLEVTPPSPARSPRRWLSARRSGHRGSSSHGSVAGHWRSRSRTSCARASPAR
jgi:hypothetical protein